MLNETLKEGGRGSAGGRQRARSALVVLEVALALVLLIGAGLMLRTFSGLHRIDAGFNPRNLLTMIVVAFPNQVLRCPKPGRSSGSLEQRIAALPGAEAAAFTTSIR
jgi:hypothetical protein